MIKPGLYVHTVKSMKPEQIYYRIRKMTGLECTIGCKVLEQVDSVHPISTIPELDFDFKFLSRFSVDEWMEDKVILLHSSHHMDWNRRWDCEQKSPLWNFNLHYFEYLFPIFDAYQKTGDRRFLDKTTDMILNWIKWNPQNKGGNGWSPYTIDLRLTNWISFYSYAERYLSDDFKEKMIVSVHEQYRFLSRHVEKDIQGNHYFEDLKTLVLCAIFFHDFPMLETALRELKKECKEEILEDGMHFELSPMYHNLILEGLIKVAAALREYGYPDPEIEAFIQPVIDAAWSLQESLERIPLFNDGGDNVSKSLEALVTAAKVYFNIDPVFKSRFPYAGYYIFKKGDWKLIVDAGQPGPVYIPGHAHCDALSFELYKAGAPVITNCGTYAYQSELRTFFRSTSAHNTVLINQVEQSQCWGIFRMAKRSRVRVIEAGTHKIVMEMQDQCGKKVRRTISMEENLTVTDEAENQELTGYLHPLIPVSVSYKCEKLDKQKQFYAPDYGQYKEICAIEYRGKGSLTIEIRLDDIPGGNHE